MEEEEQQLQPFPPPSPSPSLFLRDISNFKTPKPSIRHPNFHSPFPQFFTATKQTPSSSYSSSTTIRRHRPSIAPPSSRAKTTARRLKAFELEQSQSARKAEIKKETSFKSLAKSLTVWLNFLFENPSSCGCDLSYPIHGDKVEGLETTASANRKRNGLPDTGVGTDTSWRSPKRQRDGSWRASAIAYDDESDFASSTFSSLRSSLQEVCSFDDLKQRMRLYFSLGSCKEIFSVMSQVAKNIDEGRLKMKAHCPIVTDVGMKEHATRTLMCYNPIWLRTGLYIIFGGDSLLADPDVNTDQEITFLKMIIDKQFFSHAGLAKVYAYNKLVDGLYRPGYFENLGKIILKRFLLLVLILDRAKSQSYLPIKYGIDGVDGGSPLLFSMNPNIKSSREVIVDFLSSNVMHGEGNLVGHLVIIGYKVSFQQSPLVEYDFNVKDFFEDLKDGVRLCRAVQLLQRDLSILMKVVVPSDNRKKHFVNCSVALQYLKQDGVPLFVDEGATIIVGEDVANGEKELTVSLLWNMFVHLQLPLLIDKKRISEEIANIRGVELDLSRNDTFTLLGMLLNWIQAICENYDLKIDDFASLVDGKAMWCLLDHYFRKELHCSYQHKDLNEASGQLSIVSATDNEDAVHNFLLSQKLTTLLGNFPEVLQISDILEHRGACNERSVVILLVFLSSQLIVQKNMGQLNFHKLLGCNCQTPERKKSSMGHWFLSSEAVLDQEQITCCKNEDSVSKFKVIEAWWRDLAKQGYEFKVAISTCQGFPASKNTCNIQRDNAAKVIQSHFRRLIECRNYLKVKSTVLFLQSVVRAWLTVKQISVASNICTTKYQHFPCEVYKQTEIFGRYFMFMANRHSFVNLKKYTLLIQKAVRTWITRRNIVNNLRMNAATKIQITWRKFVMHKYLTKQCAATNVQRHCRGWLSRKRFLRLQRATIRIQNDFRQSKVKVKSAVIIQSHVRGWIGRREASRSRYLINAIQSRIRVRLMRRDFVSRIEAATKIQRFYRSFKCQKKFMCYKRAAIQIQRFVRDHITRRGLLGSSNGCDIRSSSDYLTNPELKPYSSSVLKLQRWWRSVSVFKSRTKSAIIIQSQIRGWIARRRATRERHRITVIQSYWKGYLARKEARGQLQDLRVRVKKSARNVDDGNRIINRLIAALSELLSMKSVSNILHTCATLDMATQHSQKCCEELVSGGAIDILLKLIRSVSRSIPDQEVLKHALSTLRNLARYQHLADVLIDSHQSLEIIIWELLRNKDEGYFIASDLLKRLCMRGKGVEALRSLPALLKRLHSLIEDQTKKARSETRNPRGLIARENAERRLREAVELFELATNS